MLKAQRLALDNLDSTILKKVPATQTVKLRDNRPRANPNWRILAIQKRLAPNEKRDFLPDV